MIPAPTTKLVIKGLSNMGADIPLHQAPPVSRGMVTKIVSHYVVKKDAKLALAIWLMWKTASRWDDVAYLTGAHFLVISPEEIIVHFQKTKANQAMAYKMTSLVHVRDRMPMNGQAAVLRSLKKDEKLMTLSRETFVQRIREVIAEPKLTGHSFKRGAADVLVRAAEEKIIPHSLIPQLLKHADPSNEFPEHTLAYTSTPESYARIFGSGAATILL